MRPTRLIQRTNTSVAPVVRTRSVFLRQPIKMDCTSSGFALVLDPAAWTTAHRQRVNVPLGYLVPPFLLLRRPQLIGTTVATGERPVHVELRQWAIGVVVRERFPVSTHGPERRQASIHAIGSRGLSGPLKARRLDLRPALLVALAKHLSRQFFIAGGTANIVSSARCES